MLKIEQEGNEYRLRLEGNRKRFHARNMMELIEAVKHYFQKAGFPCNPAYCPLCASMEKDAKKASRKGD